MTDEMFFDEENKENTTKKKKRKYAPPTLAQASPQLIALWQSAVSNTVKLKPFVKGVDNVTKPHATFEHFRSMMYRIRAAAERENPALYRGIASVEISENVIDENTVQAVLRPKGARFASYIEGAEIISNDEEDEDE